MKRIFTILLFSPLFCSAQTVIRDVTTCEYWVGYTSTTGTFYAIYQSSKPIALPLPGSRVIQQVAGCFNLFRAVATDGTVWQSPQYNSVSAFSWTQITTDSTGATINNATNIWGQEDNYIIRRSDGSLWYGGDDMPFIFHSSGTVFMRPYKMTTNSLVFTYVALSSLGVIASANDGNIYQWNSGSHTSPASVSTGGRSILGVAIGNYNVYCALLAVTVGATYGHPFFWGNAWGMWGSPTAQSFSTPTDLYTQWGLTSPIKQIIINSQTTEFVDSLKRGWGTGYNVQGEVGNGIEYVNRYTYINWPNYSWDFGNYENPITGVVQIGSGIQFSQMFTNPFFTFYHFALDVNDSAYSWGRNKSVVLGTGGLLDFADNPNNPNAQDVLSPTLVHPFNQNVQTLNWTVPSISAPTQSITVSSTTLSLNGHPALLVNASNVTDTVNYFPSTYAWSQLTGPNTATFSSTTAKNPTISGLINGTYTFQILTTDNNQGLNRAVKTVNVSMPVNRPYIILKRGFNHLFRQQ